MKMVAVPGASTSAARKIGAPLQHYSLYSQ